MKQRISGFLCLVCLFFCFFSFPSVSAWMLPQRTIDVTVENVSEIYWFDLLSPCEEAPLLSSDEMDALLPETYRSSPFSAYMNGYVDSEGYASFRLYGQKPYTITEDEEHHFIYQYRANLPFTYKLILVYSDGTTSVSNVITHTDALAEISYDSILYTIEEFSMNPVDSPSVQDPSSIRLQRTVGYFLIFCMIFLVQMLLYFLFGYRKKKTFVIVAFFQILVFGIMFGLLYAQKLPMFFEKPYVFMITAIMFFLISVIYMKELQFYPVMFAEKRFVRAIYYVLLSNAIAIAAAYLLVEPMTYSYIVF